MPRQHIILLCVTALALFPATAFAQERLGNIYFVTYDHYLEEKGTLEIATVPVLGRAHSINTFWGNWTEFEYGATNWWTTAFYLDAQHTRHEGSVYTGLRLENRFRVLSGDHRINPVLYIEYEHLNGADKTLKEIVGFDAKDDFLVPNSEAREETEHEIETKLILSSEIGEWNLSENFIAEKNIHEGKWEFGYAAGVSRPLKLSSSGNRCVFCRENFTAGAEVYGGLGIWGDFTLRGTSQYIAPVLKWELPSDTTLRVSPGWGLTDESLGTLWRFGVSQEIDGFGRWISKPFRRH